jgi:hypothetical protein
MFARSFRLVSHRRFVASTLAALIAGALTVACGGAPEAGSDRVVETDSALAPSACHGAANADGVVGVSCDTYSPVATSYALERLQGTTWVDVDGPTGTTPALTEDGPKNQPEGNGPPADPTYPRTYRIRAEVPVGFVYSGPIEVASPQ